MEDTQVQEEKLGKKLKWPLNLEFDSLVTLYISQNKIPANFLFSFRIILSDYLEILDNKKSCPNATIVEIPLKGGDMQWVWSGLNKLNSEKSIMIVPGCWK